MQAASPKATSGDPSWQERTERTMTCHRSAIASACAHVHTLNVWDLLWPHLPFVLNSGQAAASRAKSVSRKQGTHRNTLYLDISWYHLIILISGLEKYRYRDSPLKPWTISAPIRTLETRPRGKAEATPKVPHCWRTGTVWDVNMLGWAYVRTK